MRRYYLRELPEPLKQAMVIHYRRTIMFNRRQTTLSIASTTIIIGINVGCAFHGGDGLITPENVNSQWDSVSLAQPYAINRDTIFQDSLLQIQHGASCVDAKSAISVDNFGTYSYGVGVEDSVPIPAAYDSATVFLNGWRMQYKNKDHEVLGISTAIVNIEKDENLIRWKAGGILTDQNGDDDFVWCYHYTVLLWDTSTLNLNAVPVDSDEGARLTVVSTGSSDQTSSLYIEQNSLNDFYNTPGALLPRGFGAMWKSKSFGPVWHDKHIDLDEDTDHHLGRFALKYGDPFIITSADGSGSDIWWQFETIFSDRSIHRKYYAAEVVSLLNGESVELMQPDFEIYPGQQNGSPGYHDVVSKTIVVQDIPYDYAVPMLTGWDIGINSNSDSHIKDIGVWIEGFSYDKDPAETTGTMTYTIKSVFHDKGSNGAGVPRYQVSILGLNTRTGIVIDNPTPTTGTINEDPTPRPTITHPGTTTATLGGSGDSISSEKNQTSTGLYNGTAGAFK
jgi:hypothetical protein